MAIEKSNFTRFLDCALLVESNVCEVGSLVEFDLREYCILAELD